MRYVRGRESHIFDPFHAILLGCPSWQNINSRIRRSPPATKAKKKNS
jgi:hypothetical protein